MAENLKLAKALREAKSFLQGASNAAASNVSAPVDAIAWALRKAGVPVGDAPMGGSDWMRQHGLTAEAPGASGLIGESVGGVAPIVASAKAAQIAKGLLQAGENLAAPATMNPQAGAIVFHGSPHKFEAFDSSKIGTGEGAQAYGHGLYLADKESVAQAYKQDLGLKVPAFNGQPVQTTAESMLHNIRTNYPDADPKKMIDAYVNGGVFGGNSEKMRAELYAAADKYSGAKPTTEVQGSLYKVDLPDEAIAKMLDYDKPLSQQAPEVQAALSRLIEPPHTSLPPGYKVQEIRALSEALGSPQFRPFVPGGDPMTMQTFGGSDAATNYALNQLNEFRAKPTDLGRSLYNSISRNAADASAALRQAGIPGIRYLDQGSRGAGQGSSNYVVFPGNENLLTILERNGQLLGTK